MTDFLYPTAAELKEVEQDLLPRMEAQREVFSFFPLSEDDQSTIMWEQQDNWTGLQAVRGLDGAPTRVKRTGGKRFVMEPGVYGDFTLIDEAELTRRRPYGGFGPPVAIDDLVGRDQARLMTRRLDRVESIIWTLLTTGTFSVATPFGPVIHTDSYTLQTFSSGVAWATSGTAAPLADLRAVKLLQRGHSVKFDSSAKAYANATTLNRLYANGNSQDIYGRRTAGLGTFNSPDQVNALLTGDNLPKLVEYDEGYMDDTNTFQLFIPNGKVVVVGQRPNGEPVGEYKMTRNANNPAMAPGSYQRVIDRGEDTIPRSIEVHDGHNGGPAIYWPSAVVVMSV